MKTIGLGKWLEELAKIVKSETKKRDTKIAELEKEVEEQNKLLIEADRLLAEGIAIITEDANEIVVLMNERDEIMAHYKILVKTANNEITKLKKKVHNREASIKTLHKENREIFDRWLKLNLRRVK